MASLGVGLLQVGEIAMSDYVAVCRPAPEGVVTWFVTGFRTFALPMICGRPSGRAAQDAHEPLDTNWLFVRSTQSGQRRDGQAHESVISMHF